MSRRHLATLALLPAAATLGIVALSAVQPRRLALVVGNDRYAGRMGLQNARRDAAAIAAELRAMGFETTHVEDAPRARFNRAIETFASALAPTDIALFYCSRHSGFPGCRSATSSSASASASTTSPAAASSLPSTTACSATSSCGQRLPAP
jgi:uncharacterized caspase-like protein